MNPFYQTGEQRAAKVKALFDGIARRYDLINDVQSCGLHRIWKRRVVQLAKPHPDHLLLDVCCGTGDIALALAGSGARTIGLDFSPSMLQIACQRARQTGLGGIRFLRGNALKLPFLDNVFDGITIGYGLRNLANFEDGLSEMARVLKPGGPLLVLDFGQPDNALWRWLYVNYLKFMVPVYGRIFCGSTAAYAYILESLNHYPAPKSIAAMMSKVGCQNVRVINLLGGAMSIHHGQKGYSRLLA